MPHVNEFYQKILEGPIDSNLRREILEEIVRCLELKRNTLGTWEKTLFAQALAYLSINAVSTYQRTSLWLRLCLVCLENAMVPRRELNCPHSLATWLVRLSVFPALQNRPFLA